MRLIDADEVLDIAAAYCPDDDGSCSNADRDMRELLDEIEGLPTIEAEPVRHGYWFFKDNIYPVCSECNELSDYNCDGTHKQSSYCPSCGAKMDGGNENET